MVDTNIDLEEKNEQVSEPVSEQATEQVVGEVGNEEATTLSSQDKVKNFFVDFANKTKDFFVVLGAKTKKFFGDLNDKLKNSSKKEENEELSSNCDESECAPKSAQDKIKGFFADCGNKIKGLFEKEDKVIEIDGIVLTDPNANLSTGERIRRFLKAEQGWLFVLPAVILLCIFTFYPIINAFIGAFKQDYNALENTFNGWGIDNFTTVLKGDTGTGGANFIQCLLNTMILTFISVPLSTLVALLISVALTNIKALQKAYQTVLFLPYLTNSLAMGAVFATFFKMVGTQSSDETVGLFNMFLGLFGVEPIDWIENGAIPISSNFSLPWAQYVVAVIYEVWSGLPFKILILFSALQSVNKQYYDAAKIDGASRSTMLWKITVPMIFPMISYLLVTGVMGGMKQYTSILGLFNNNGQMGMDYIMGTMVGYIYQYLDNAYTGYAFAGSLILFAVIMVITAFNGLINKKGNKV